MANLHKIKAQLYDNVLTPNPNDIMARVSSERSLSVKDICQSAVTRGGADISAAAMEHAVNLYHKEMGYSMCDGFSVNTGWYTASVSIKGVFDSPAEKFNPAKHTVMFDFNDLLTPNRNLRINGSKIKIDGENTENGVYFVHQDTKERTRVDNSDIATNNPSEIMIVIPELPAGTYKLEITTQYSPGKNLKQSRTAVFERILTVE